MVRSTSLLGRFAIILCIAVLIGACAPFTTQPQVCPCGPAPEVFAVQLGQSSASGAVGTFELRMVDITPQQFRFYYVFKSSHSSSIRVTASAEASANASPPQPLTVTVQVLGQLGAYQVGVIHVTRGQNVAQTISLAITPSNPVGGNGATVWRLSPVKQLIPQPHAHSARTGVGWDPVLSPEAQWSAEVAPQLVSYVKIIIPGQPAADRSYVFLRSDDAVVVTVITKAQYLAFAGAVNFTP